jgi:transposase
MSQPKIKQKRKRKKLVAGLPEQLQSVNLNAAGIDVGAEEHLVAVPPGSAEVPVQRFSAFTASLELLADWLEECGVTTVVMESTGVYWIPLYELLERRGFEVKLVDARHVKNVSGRKSDVLDCQWLQQLHTYGLLSAAFRPPDEICVLRSYLRQKEMLTQASSQHIQHMQKALQQMNVLLHRVVSDITGATGMKIIQAILQGERAPEVLARHRHATCKRSEAEIAAALHGNYRDEHLFALRQALELYETYQQKIADCEAAIVQQLGTYPDATQGPIPPPSKPSNRSARIRSDVDIRELIFQKTGVDLFALPGMGADTLLTILSEIGFDLRPWKTVQHFTSWLGLCPDTRISGGRKLTPKHKRKVNRAAQAFRTAAVTLHRSPTALGAFFRRVKMRTGSIQAITATAHKLARIFYGVLTTGAAYFEVGQQAYEERFRERSIAQLERKAKSLGLQLVPASVS